MRSGLTSQGAPTSFRHSRESAAVVGSGEEVVFSLIRTPEGLNHLSTSPTRPIYFLSSLSYLCHESSFNSLIKICMCTFDIYVCNISLHPKMSYIW